MTHSQIIKISVFCEAEEAIELRDYIMALLDEHISDKADLVMSVIEEDSDDAQEEKTLCEGVS